MLARVLSSCCILTVGCTLPPSPDPEEKASLTLPAPKTPEAPLRITAADAGKTFTIQTGQTFAVEMIGIPTAGYSWNVVNVPKIFVPAGETGGATHRDQLQPGFAGGHHWEVLLFKATSVGAGTLQLEQRRAWESNKPALKTFKVKIKVVNSV